MPAARPRRPFALAPVQARRPAPPVAAVGFLEHRDDAARDEHERTSLRELTERLSRLKGLPCVGRFGDSSRRIGPTACYVVAPDTLLTDEARALGISTRADLFGGVVAHRVHASKAIVHTLLPDARVAPTGWREGLAQRVSPVVLPGFTAFSRLDARRAITRLLEAGRVRVKPCVDGRSQWTVDSVRDADPLIDALEEAALERDDIACELELADTRTVSVGQVDVGACRISYCGLRRQTLDRGGSAVYGGSELVVVRGEFEDLLQLRLPAAVRVAIRQARWFDTAAGEWLPERLVSRNHYDVIQGRDREGRARSAVLGQSWCPGGASAAEVAALEYFASHGDVGVLRVATVTRYGTLDAPRGALVHYRGDDPRQGPMVKYTQIVAGREPTRLFHDGR